jgi:hypothetical protein
MARLGRWTIAVIAVIMLAGTVSEAGAQIIINTGHPHHRRYHRHYRHHRR